MIWWVSEAVIILAEVRWVGVGWSHPLVWCLVNQLAHGGFSPLHVVALD